MGAEHGHRAVGNFVQFLDEMSALLLQRIDHVPVVYDFVAHIDGLAALLKRPLDDLDGADDTRAETTGLCKNDAHHGYFFSHRETRHRPAEMLG